MKYFFLLASTLCVCFCTQYIALREIGGRTVKSESNYFSSLGRIQSGAIGKPEVMLLGSSITGRLPDRAQGFQGVACMGCDGGSAADTIRAIDEGIIPRAPVIIVEANTLPVALAGKSQIGTAIRAPWFRAGIFMPLLSAYARPSAFLYSPLLSSRTGSYNLNQNSTLGVVTKPVSFSPEWDMYQVDSKEAALIADLSARIKRLCKNGSRVILVWLPPRRPQNQPPPPWILKLAAESEIEWWDLGQDAKSSEVKLTDRVHMDAESASKTLRSILSALQ